RSGRYVDGFQGIFTKQGLPEELALLPLVESSFENRSFSKAGAAGIWQFTRSTGRLYLRVNRKLDDRLDPMKSTQAAARLLNDQYFGQLTLDRPSAKQAVLTSTTSTAATSAAPRRKVQTAKTSPADKYRVRKGDTLWDTAQRFGTSIRDLMERNNLQNSAIHAG